MENDPTPLLRGDHVMLRLVREDDLKPLFERLQDLSSRGDYYPIGVGSEPAFVKEYRETGFWTPDYGVLVMVDHANRLVGRILYYSTVPYLDELEIGYHLFDTAERGKGYTTEALQLLTKYLFATRQVNRLRLVIHGDNVASRRIADKCSYRHEGTNRGAWFHQGSHHDVEVYALLRTEFFALGTG
jgi:ribosomal-protein-alanine N-acetyltransferase